MIKEEVELLPAGLVSCFVESQEVRVLKISPESLTVRIDEEIENNSKIKVAFYIFEEFRYEELIIEAYSIVEKKECDFYFTYTFAISNDAYLRNVRSIIMDYSKYIRLKVFGYENEFSKEMVGYPAELDYDFCEVYSKQKKEWVSRLNYAGLNENNMNGVELAVSLDNDSLYQTYMDKDIKAFKEYYLRENGIKDDLAYRHLLFKKDISRLYIGNEFCHNLFPHINMLINMLHKAKKEELQITLGFTYLRDCYIEKTKNILNRIYKWCVENNKDIEIIVNDWGMLKLIEDKTRYIKPILGVLLNKRQKDPRHIYKKGYIENNEKIAQNNLNSAILVKFLKEFKIERYEYENCGYRMTIAKGNHSLHIPFYQTNTSQYCPLYAMCENGDRGKQKLVSNCPKYCKDYVFAYPKHLKMVGRYNSLFAFDDTILKNPKELDYYTDSGIDRVVLNFI